MEMEENIHILCILVEIEKYPEAQEPPPRCILAENADPGLCLLLPYTPGGSADLTNGLACCLAKGVPASVPCQSFCPSRWT